MGKRMLITGSTDGIGLETAKMLISKGHSVLLHGRSPEKLEDAEKSLFALSGGGQIESYLADLSLMADVEKLAQAVSEKHSRLDVLINNAGVFRTPDSVTPDGLDIRFAVNTIAPYLLTKRLLPLLGPFSRVINLSSAAQAPVDLDALAGRVRVADDFEVYGQSKLALTMWSFKVARELGEQGLVVIAVNPGSLLGTKMVREGFGMEGKDVRIGADILTRLALEDEFASHSGKYFDNDSGRFAPPHPDALDPGKCEEVVRVIEAVLAAIVRQIL